MGYPDRIYEYLGVKSFREALLHIAKYRKNEIPFKNYFLKEYSIDALKNMSRCLEKAKKLMLL
jgi:hypothetical protein